MMNPLVVQQEEEEASTGRRFVEEDFDITEDIAVIKRIPEEEEEETS